MKYSKACECKLKSVRIFVQHANKNVPVIQVNRFRNRFFLMSAMSKVIFGFSAVFNETMQNMTIVCEYTIEKIIVSVIENVTEARQFRVAVSYSFASLFKRL